MPLGAPKKEPKTLPIDSPEKDSKIGDDILDHDLDEGEVHNPVNRANILTGLHTHRELVEAQMQGGLAFSSSRYSQDASSNSEQARTAPEPLNCAPPQEVLLARFPKKDLVPNSVVKQTIDVKADKHYHDAKLSHIPDFRKDWGDGEKWTLHRRADRVYVDPSDIEEVKLHGCYVVFATFGQGYSKSEHKYFEGKGKHVHDDFFIAKIQKRPDDQGWTAYVDMPNEFWTAKTKGGKKVYECRLVERNKSMLDSLFEW